MNLEPLRVNEVPEVLTKPVGAAVVVVAVVDVVFVVVVVVDETVEVGALVVEPVDGIHCE